MRTVEILIVDDNPTLVMLVREFVSRLAARPAFNLKCDFVVAGSVRAARAHMGLRRFDAVVLDLFLADSDPGEALIPLAGGSHVVVLSGIDEHFDAARLAAVQALRPAAIHRKPPDWPELAAAVLAPWRTPHAEGSP